MIASLPMYNRPELIAEINLFWDLIREGLTRAGIKSPSKLDQNADLFETWLHPELVLSQTCGLPYRLKLHGQTTLVGTPDFGLTGCPPGYYQSLFLVRRNDERKKLIDFSDTVLAYNEKGSQSGYAAPQTEAHSQGFEFTKLFQSGAHELSARLVAEGSADITAVDAVSWRYMDHFDDMSADLKILAKTTPTPGLPFISARGARQPELFKAIEIALQKMPRTAKQRLGMQGLVHIPAEEYLSVPNP